jgi:3'(2'), 5'-bisphosphate nucleotidase
MAIAVERLWSHLRKDLSVEYNAYRRRLSTLLVEQKVDQTLLTEADIAIQALIVDRIRYVDPVSPIIGEEDDADAALDKAAVPSRFWVIDPIDGTSEFVDSARRDFCSVVCLVEDGYPVCAFVYAPELINGEAFCLTVDALSAKVHINGASVSPQAAREPSRRASVTRSNQLEPTGFDAFLVQAGYWIKTKATSQTIDMIRTCIDLSRWTGNASDFRFDFFWREDQKIWDGLAGLCLARTLGFSWVDGMGRPRLPVTASDLSRAHPSFDCTIVGRPEAVQWFLNLL